LQLGANDNVLVKLGRCEVPAAEREYPARVFSGIQEVAGSIPSSSTNEFEGLEGFPSKAFPVGVQQYIQMISGGWHIGWLEDHQVGVPNNHTTIIGRQYGEICRVMPVWQSGFRGGRGV